MSDQIQRKPQQDSDMIDMVKVKKIMGRLWKGKAWILSGAVLGAVICFAYLWLAVTPLYKASVTLYVNNSSSQENSGSITQSDIYASTQLVDTYAAIILSDAILEAVIDDTALDMTIDELSEILSIESVNNTEVFQVAVLYSDPETAARIVDSIAQIAPERIASIVKGSSVTVINYARMPDKIAYPDYIGTIMKGFAAGAIFLTGCLIIRDMMNTRIRSESDFSRWKYPLLASVPDLMDKGQSGYGYYEKEADKKTNTRRKEEKKKKENIRRDRQKGPNDSFLLSDEVPFGAQEAYKTLRTNVIFSSPDQEKKIILITSARQGEAKTTTAFQLASAFAQNQSRVLLMDCDLRIPMIARRLGIKQIPGLTDLILGMETGNSVIYELKNGLHVLTAGTIPPNPTEILGSKRMEYAMDQLVQSYDYIIMDTPPLDPMSDAVVLARYATDVILAVRQNTTEKTEIDAAVEKLELVKAKILGFVFTCVTENERHSYRKRGYEYYYSYAASNPSEGGLRKSKGENEDMLKR